MPSQDFLQFKGENYLRQRLVMSLLSNKPVLITDIRPQGPPVGLVEYEASFLRLIEKLTTGTNIVINHTGTEIQFQPGRLKNLGGPGCGHGRRI